MDKEFETIGYWWPSGQDEKRIHGKLRFSPQQGASLELDGTWTDTLEELPREFINGLDSKGDLFTLRNCQNINFEYNLWGIPQAVYRVGQIFKGIHFQRKEDIRFFEITVEYTHLGDWVNLSGFKMPSSFSKSFEIGYKQPDELLVYTAPDWVCKIGTGYSANVHRFGIREVRIEESNALVIQRDPNSQEASLDDYFMEKIYALRDLLILATNSPISLLKLIGHTHAKETMQGQKLYPIPIEIFGQQMWPQKIEKIYPDEMLFKYSDISENPQNFFSSWFQIRQECKRALDLLVSQFFVKGYNEDRFLNLARALEVYHRLRLPNQELPEELHQARLGEILNNTPPEYKAWLAQKLAYSNEPTFEARLKELFNHNQFLKELILNIDDFCKRVKDTRNFYTHYSKSLEKKAARGAELYYLGNKLKVFLILIILKELGFSESAIRKIVQKPKINWELQSVS